MTLKFSPDILPVDVVADFSKNLAERPIRLKRERLSLPVCCQIRPAIPNSFGLARALAIRAIDGALCGTKRTFSGRVA